MERCFMNLGIVDTLASERRDQTLASRIQTETPEHSDQVDLSTLFESRQLA